jgi:hypothetical protein
MLVDRLEIPAVQSDQQRRPDHPQAQALALALPVLVVPALAQALLHVRLECQIASLNDKGRAT